MTSNRVQIKNFSEHVLNLYLPKKGHLRLKIKEGHRFGVVEHFIEKDGVLTCNVYRQGVTYIRFRRNGKETIITVPSYNRSCGRDLVMDSTLSFNHEFPTNLEYQEYSLVLPAQQTRSSDFSRAEELEEIPKICPDKRGRIIKNEHFAEKVETIIWSPFKYGGMGVIYIPTRQFRFTNGFWSYDQYSIKNSDYPDVGVITDHQVPAPALTLPPSPGKVYTVKPVSCQYGVYHFDPLLTEDGFYLYTPAFDLFHFTTEVRLKYQGNWSLLLDNVSIRILVKGTDHKVDTVSFLLNFTDSVEWNGKTIYCHQVGYNIPFFLVNSDSFSWINFVSSDQYWVAWGRHDHFMSRLHKKCSDWENKDQGQHQKLPQFYSRSWNPFDLCQCILMGSHCMNISLPCYQRNHLPSYECKNTLCCREDDATVFCSELRRPDPESIRARMDRIASLDQDQ